MPNPFFYAGKIEDPAHFVGRQAELRRIFGALETAHTGQVQHVSVVGSRRIGKSSLLAHVIHSAPNYLQDAGCYRFVYVDLTDARCHTLPGLISHMLRGLGVLQPPAGQPLEHFTEVVERFCSRQGQVPVFCLDEFEHLTASPQEFPDALYDAWRSLGANSLCAFLIASHASLKNLAGQGRLTSSFFNIFIQLELGQLAEGEASQLVEQGLGCDRPFTLRECSELLHLGGCHPYRLQLAASLLYQAKASPPVDWRALRREYQSQVDFIFDPPVQQGFWQHLESAAKKVLRWPAWFGRTILEIFGRENISDSTALVVGYFLLLLILSMMAGWLSPSLLQDAWRFFNPVK